MTTEITGVYTASNLETGEFYIGSSRDIASREKQHLALLSKNKHPNHRFQDAYNRNPNFQFRGFGTRDRETAYILEQNALNDNYGDPLNLNLSNSAVESRPGFHTQETKDKISKARMGYKWGERTQTEAQKEASARSWEAAQKAQEEKKRPVSIEGKEFPSMNAAEKELGISRSLIRNRVISGSERFKDWQFKEKSNDS